MDETPVPKLDGLSRRMLLGGLSAATLGLKLSPAWATEINSRRNGNVRFLDHDEAVEEGRRRDIGRAELLAPEPGQEIAAASRANLSFRYTVGATGIEPGGFIWFTMRHVFHSTVPQTTDPAQDGFVKLEGPETANLRLVLWPDRADSQDLFLQAFPWQHPIEVRLESGELRPGDTITLHYGDTSGGGRGFNVQPSQESGFAFRVYVASSPQEPILPLAQDLILPIVGGPVEKLSLLAPSSIKPGQPISLLVRAEDRFGNESVSYESEIVVRADDGTELARHAMGSQDRGLLRLEVAPPRSSGVVRFTVEDGERSARSNPTRIIDDSSRLPLYFGDTHGHTLFSDGRGTPDGYYRYARDVAALDFCALTDHDFMLSDEMWLDLQASTERFNEPGRFATFHAFEWSGMTEVGGDHNVYFRGTETAITRCRSYYDYRNQQAYHGREPQTNHIEDLYAFLLSRFAEGEVMVIPHYGGRPANPNWHEPRLERMIEIFSDHRRSHDWAYPFLQRGYRMGILASSDNHIGRPGYGFLHNPLLSAGGVEIGTGLVAVYAPERSREAIFDSLFSRFAYATSGDRILLHVGLGTARMGQEMSGPTPQILQVEIEGTDTVSAVEIIKDGLAVHTVSGGAESIAFEWSDPTPPNTGSTSAYWVRVVQNNNEEAISSPIWWTVLAA